MDDYDNGCWRPIQIVDWQSVVNGIDAHYLWAGLVIGYLGALLTILIIAYIANWRDHG